MELKKRSKQVHKHSVNCNIHISGWMKPEKNPYEYRIL